MKRPSSTGRRFPTVFCERAPFSKAKGSSSTSGGYIETSTWWWWCILVRLSVRTKTSVHGVEADNILHITCGSGGGDQLRKKARARLVSSRPTNKQLTGGKIEPLLLLLYLRVYSVCIVYLLVCIIL